MRIRSIKPEFWDSESMGRVTREARLLFIGLWSLADDSGRTRADSRFLASRLFPYDSDAQGKIKTWLSELSREGSIRIYVVDENHYLDIPKWLIHQKIDRPSKSQFPEFGEGSRVFGEGSISRAHLREQGEEQGEEQGQPPSPKAGKRVESMWLMDLWNSLADPALARCKEWTLSRQKAAQKTLKAHPNHEDWEMAIQVINYSPFHLGQLEGKPWKANIDWLIRPEGQKPAPITTLLERYDEVSVAIVREKAEDAEFEAKQAEEMRQFLEVMERSWKERTPEDRAEQCRYDLATIRNFTPHPFAMAEFIAAGWTPDRAVKEKTQP